MSWRIRTGRLPDLRFRWMRRYDFTWVELVFCVAVSCGGLVTLLTPSRVSRVVELSGPAADHPTAALILAGALVGILVHQWSVVWGPIRVDRPTTRWILSGPDDRNPPLARRLATTCAAAIGCCVAAAAVLTTLHPGSVPIVLPAGAAVGAVAIGAAYVRQVTADRRHSSALAFGLSPKRLHRNSFAPHDGYADALRLAASMLDTGWLTDNRTVRWQRRHSAAQTRPLPRSWMGVVVEIDRRRMLRHPDACVRWLVCVAAVVVVPQVITVHYGSALVIAALAYAAGNSLTGGLRAVTENPALRRATGLADRPIMLAHMVLPAFGVVVACAVGALAWQLSITATSALLCGILFAVYRHATRPPLPYDAPAVTESLVTGATIQPQLFTAMLRGTVAMLGTGVIVGML